jgi:hypothetical protein
MDVQQILELLLANQEKAAKQEEMLAEMEADRKRDR